MNNILNYNNLRIFKSAYLGVGILYAFGAFKSFFDTKIMDTVSVIQLLAIFGVYFLWEVWNNK